jgi:L-cysteine S-thiosulfotransferase
MKAVGVLMLCIVAMAAHTQEAAKDGAAKEGAAKEAAAKQSGFAFMSKPTQAMQLDDTQNPGMLWVRQGEQVWGQAAGNNKSCASCHHSLQESMRGAAARYPAWDAPSKQAVNLAQRINLCRTRYQGAAAWAWESQELLALEAAVALQSRGLPLTPAQDAALAPHRARGQALYTTRLGQLDLSCAQCHDQRAGLRLAGSTIPQAHIGNYPSYRLEWQTIGSLQRRLRNCMTGVRAEPYAFGAPEWVEIELYLAQRSAGLPLEAPSVRP